MKYPLSITLAASLFVANGYAQDRVFRCDNNEYINNVTEATRRACKEVTGGNVTIVQGTKVQAPAAPGVKVATAPQSTQQQRVDANEQRARDSDMRGILEAELRKAEARQAELLKEYNNGEPDKVGIEGRNYQRYLDRVAEMKAAIARNDSDIAGIKRELSRIPASK